MKQDEIAANTLNRQQNATTIDFNWIHFRFGPEKKYTCVVVMYMK